MTAGFTIRRALPADHAAVAREFADYLGFIGDALDADGLDHDYRAYGFSEIPRYNDNHRADIWMERSL
jgi:hypothetical protein